MLFLTGATAAQAKGETVLVLPFAVQAGPELPDAVHAVPMSIVEKLAAQGMRPLSMEKSTAIYRESGLKTLDLAAARQLGVTAGADVVIYGAFTQDGRGFVMDTRIVPVSGARPVPARFVRPNMTDLAEASTQLASRTAATLNPVATPAAAPEPATPAKPAEPAPAQLVPMNLPTSGKGLADVQVRGLRNMDPDVVLMRLTIRKGDSPDANAINQEVMRLWEMGYFTDVQAHMEGNVLVFDVVEKPRIDNIIVEGASAIDQEDIIAAMTTRTGNVLNEQTLAEDLQRITELYRKEGYYLAKPTYRFEDRTGRRGTILVINVNEGNKLYITEVKVDGLKELKQSDMEKYMALRERGLFSWITGSGVLKEEYLERDTNAIAAYGLNEGYVDMQVGAPEVDYKEDGIHIIFPVSEGPRYNVNEVSFAGDVLDTQENMEKLVEMDEWKAENSYFSLTVMQEDAKRLQNYYNDQGYAYAEVDTRVIKPDDKPGTVNVCYVINKRQKIFVRRLLVEGNLKTRDNVILREMRLGDGDPYEGAKLRRSTERLNRLRYFSALDTELVPTESEDQVDLKVKVKEANTGALMAGIGYSTYFDVGVNASIMERNLFGRGYQLALSGFFSWRRTSGTLTFNNPRVYDTDTICTTTGTASPVTP